MCTGQELYLNLPNLKDSSLAVVIDPLQIYRFLCLLVLEYKCMEIQSLLKLPS